MAIVIREMKRVKRPPELSKLKKSQIVEINCVIERMSSFNNKIPIMRRIRMSRLRGVMLTKLQKKSLSVN
jgi:hypothetical protein